MYKIYNGILHKDGKPIFALGESYYPSFHHAKYPVPPDGDRIGEMKKDFKMMKEAGFNFIRMAAIGDIRIENENIVIDTPFADAMLSEAEELNIATSVRLQGYILNLSGNKNFRMINNEGEEQDKNVWFDFIQACMYHEGILKDNEAGTSALAHHFRRYPNMVGYQIYNEPHYPKNGFYDYHPKTIAKYREWLIEKGVMKESEAKSYEPPRKRPKYYENPLEWINWRLFSQNTLSGFLNTSARIAKSAHNEASTYTCLTTDQLSTRNAFRGVDFFECAEGMDMLGYTCYIKAAGPDYFYLCLCCDLVQSAAAVVGKHAWCIELDSRTSIPQRQFNQETYVTVGAGIKGIVYYQWRGDYPSEATPVPNGCGLINYDGTKTGNYENAVNMVKLLNELSDDIICAEKVRYGIGVLFSDYASMYCDAKENNDLDLFDSGLANKHCRQIYDIYKDIRKAGLSVEIVKAKHLMENPLDIKVLYVPTPDILSEEEKQYIKAFHDNGGRVFNYKENHIAALSWGFVEYDTDMEIYTFIDAIEDTLEKVGIDPLIKTDERIMIQLLKGKGYYVACLTNISTSNKQVKDVRIKTSISAKKAVFYTNLDQPEKLNMIGDTIHIPSVHDGGFLIIQV